MTCYLPSLWTSLFSPCWTLGKASKQIVDQPCLTSFKDYATHPLPPFTSLCRCVCFCVLQFYTVSRSSCCCSTSSFCSIVSISLFSPLLLNFFHRYIAFSVWSKISLYQLVVLNLLSSEQIGYCLFSLPLFVAKHQSNNYLFYICFFLVQLWTQTSFICIHDINDMHYPLNFKLAFSIARLIWGNPLFQPAWSCIYLQIRAFDFNLPQSLWLV